MSFDQDPGESVTISGADFALMKDEISRLNTTISGAQAVWKAIGEEAECVVMMPGNRKHLLLTEEMCVRLGGALGL